MNFLDGIIEEVIEGDVTENFSFHEIDLEQLHLCFKSVKPSLADKYGDIPSFIFLDHFAQIRPEVLKMFNLCINLCLISVNLSRPISVLPFLAKVFERVLFKQLVSYFERNNLFSTNQFGFHRNKSTTQGVFSRFSQIS